MSLAKLVLAALAVELERGARRLIRYAIRKVTEDPPVAVGRVPSYKDVQHVEAQIASAARPFPERDASPAILPVRPRPAPGER